MEAQIESSGTELSELGGSVAELNTESGFISLSSGSSGTELSMYAYDIDVL